MYLWFESSEEHLDTPWIYTSHEHDEDGDDNEIFLLSAINSDLSRLC
jgi:hypothetical protein